MKKIDLFIISLAFMSIVIIACNSRTKVVQNDPMIPQAIKDKADSTFIDQNRYISREKNGVTIYTVDGHEYLYFNHYSVIHNVACPNPKCNPKENDDQTN